MPIPAGLMVRDARLDGQPVPLIEGPPAHVMLSRAGRSVLSLEHLVAAQRHRRAPNRSRCRRRPRRAVARHADAAAQAASISTVSGGFVSERSESRVRKPVDGARPRQSAARLLVETQGRRSPRGTAAALSAPASRRWSASAKKCRRSRRPSASKCCRAWRARSRSPFRRASSINQVNGATVADWEVQGRLLRVRLLDPVADRVVVRGAGREPAACRRRGAQSRWSACPPPNARPAAWRSACSAPGEIEKHLMRGLEPARRLRPRRRSSPAASRRRWWRFACGRSAGADARSLNVSVKRYTPQAVLDRQHRGGALPRARRRRRPVPGRSALRRPQQPAQLPEGRRCRRGATIWSASVAGKPVRPGVAEGDAVLLAAREGPRRRGRADVRRADHLLAAGRSLDRQGARSARAAGARPADFAHRGRALSLAAVSRRCCSRERSASSPIRACSRRRLRRTRGAAQVSDFRSGSGGAGRAVAASAAIAASPPPGADENRRDRPVAAS